MNLIYIDGSEDVLFGLGDIPDMILELGSAEQLEGGTVRVTAYATDRAIEEIQSRGATVGIEMNNDQLKEQLDNLYEQIEESEPPVA